MDFIHGAVSLTVRSSASVWTVPTYASFEKATTAITGIDSIMLTGGSVSADFAGNIQETTLTNSKKKDRVTHFGLAEVRWVSKRPVRKKRPGLMSMYYKVRLTIFTVRLGFITLVEIHFVFSMMRIHSGWKYCCSQGSHPILPTCAS